MYSLLLAILITLLSARSEALAQDLPVIPLATESVVTAMAMGHRGELIVATAGGDIRLLQPGGDAVVLAQGIYGVRCLSVSPRGDIFAYSAPGANIVRLDRQGQTDVVADGLEDVRALAVDRDGGIFVTHGSRGVISKLHAVTVHKR